MKKELLKVLINTKERKNLRVLGEKMFELYSAHGLPPDMILDRVRDKLNKDEMITVLNVYFRELVKHKIKSGVTEKNLNKCKLNNMKTLLSFYNTGEVGIF